MHKTALALAALLLSTAAYADTLVDNVRGIQVGADGKLERFVGLVFADDGKVVQLIRADDEKNRPRSRGESTAEGARCCLG